MCHLKLNPNVTELLNVNMLNITMLNNNNRTTIFPSHLRDVPSHFAWRWTKPGWPVIILGSCYQSDYVKFLFLNTLSILACSLLRPPMCCSCSVSCCSCSVSGHLQALLVQLTLGWSSYRCHQPLATKTECSSMAYLQSSLITPPLCSSLASAFY